MLRYLSVRNFVIVDHLELEFRSGLTVLTGETGAGKSILVDALSLALGERADASLVRTGAERAEITVEFDISKLKVVEQWLSANELTGDSGVCLLRRNIDTSGRSRAFINGHPATLQQLKDVGDELVDVLSQHAHQSLLKADVQRDLLDAYGGLEELRGSVKKTYQAWLVTHRQRLDWEKNSGQIAAEVNDLEWRIRELSELNITQDEWQDLQNEHARLTHATSLMEGAQYGLDVLSESEAPMLSTLNALTAKLEGLAHYDAALKEILDLLHPAHIQLQEAAYSLNHYLQKIDVDPGRLQASEQRLQQLHSAARKYKVNVEQLPELLENSQTRLNQLNEIKTEQDLVKREELQHREFLEVAKKLSSARNKVAVELSKKVTQAMQKLAMADGRFSINLRLLEQGSAHGLEQPEFLVAAHKSLELKSLAKVASGGELSRISLAIQVVTSDIATVPTLIFDEVDVGIGGKVAEIVGQLLKQLAKRRQVLCITHLPQVAAQGMHHWKVDKQSLKTGVSSHIVELQVNERIEELARMLGGIEVTETTRAHAAEMLKA